MEMKKAAKPEAHASKSKLNFKLNEHLRLVLLISITVEMIPWMDFGIAYIFHTSLIACQLQTIFR